MSARHKAFADSLISDEMAAAILTIIESAGYEIKRKAASRKVAGMPAWEAWETAHMQAKQAATNQLGERWYLIPGASQYVTIPRNWANYRFTRKDGTLSVPIKNRRDYRAPAPRFWPGGTLPTGLEVEENRPAYFTK